MPMLVWVAIVVGLFIVLSLLVGLALAAILGAAARETSELYQGDVWSTLPPTRAVAIRNSRMRSRSNRQLAGGVSSPQPSSSSLSHLGVGDV
jgi:hypothetical protein